MCSKLKQDSIPFGMQYLLPYNRGALRETLAGSQCVLYWAGGTYAWDLKHGPAETVAHLRTAAYCRSVGPIFHVTRN